MICTAIAGDDASPDSKVYEADMGPVWGRQDPGGPRVGPMNLSIGVSMQIVSSIVTFET